MTIKSRLGELVHFYWFTFHRSWQNFVGKGVMGRELLKEISGTDLINPEHQPKQLGVLTRDGIPDIPPRYEDEYFNQNDFEEKIKSELGVEFVTLG